MCFRSLSTWASAALGEGVFSTTPGHLLSLAEEERPISSTHMVLQPKTQNAGSGLIKKLGMQGKAGIKEQLCSP